MAKQATEFRVMVSPITKTAYAGRVKNLGNGTFESSGVRHDVTSDILPAAMAIIGINETIVLSADGVPQFEIEVRDVRNLT